MPPSRQPKFPPLTVSRAALLQGGRDDAFRDVIQDLVDFSSRLAQIRETLARQVGLSPPQYRLLMELAHWSQTKPTVGEIAEAVNDTLFKEFSGADMKALGRFARALLDASQEGLAQAKRPVQKPRPPRSRLKTPGRAPSSK